MEKKDDIWKNKLTPEQYSICRMKGTEPPFSGKYYECKDKGTYNCVCCGIPLFSSQTKFDSHTGWPSFWEPIADNIRSETDTSYGVSRTEVLCKNCGAHLGHEELHETSFLPSRLQFRRTVLDKIHSLT